MRKGVWFRILVFFCMLAWMFFLMVFSHRLVDTVYDPLAHDSLRAHGTDLADLPAFTRNVAMPIMSAFDYRAGQFPTTWVSHVTLGVVFFGPYFVLLAGLLGKYTDRTKRRFLYAVTAYLGLFLAAMLCTVIGLALAN